MTLAQNYIERGTWNKTGDTDLDQMKCWAHGLLRGGLLLPTSPDPARAESCAERYVFDEDVNVFVSSLVKAGSVSDKVIRETAKLSRASCWFEQPITWTTDEGRTTHGRIGMFVTPVKDAAILESNPLEKYFLVAAAENELLPTPLLMALLSFPAPPWPASERGTAFTPFFLFDKKNSAMNETDTKLAQQLIFDLLDFLFLLNTPRVCEVKTVSWNAKKQKARERSGKLPLVELKRTTIRIGKPAVRYENGHREVPEVDEPGHRKRYHRVMPFFRTYREGREVPKVSLVDEHWRGDPLKGIVLHEKVIKP